MADAPTTQFTESHSQTDLIPLNVPIGRRCCAACVDLVRKRLRENQHVKRVRVNGDEGVAYVNADAGTVSIEELSAIAGECCGDSSPVPLPDATVSSHHHMHSANPEAGAHAPEAHAVANAEGS